MVVLSADGRQVGVASGPASNVDHVTPDRQAALWAALRDAACAAAGVDPGDVRTAVLGVAGVTTERDRRRVRTAASHARLATTVLVDHDGAIAVEGAHLGDPGLLLIAGTGSACYGRDRSGAVFRVGGWGYWIGDEGSATWIGSEGLRAAARAVDRRGPATTLVEAAMQALGVDEPAGFLHALYIDADPRAASGAFAPVVLQAARSGDVVARDVVGRAADHLADLVVTGVATLASDAPPRLATVGGAIDDPLLDAALQRTLASRTVEVEIVDAEVPPVLGAASMALLHEGCTRASVDACVTNVRDQVVHDLASIPEVTIP